MTETELRQLITREKTGLIAYRCLECGVTMTYSSLTGDGRSCINCNGHITPLGYAKYAVPYVSKQSERVENEMLKQIEIKTDPKSLRTYAAQKKKRHRFNATTLQIIVFVFIVGLFWGLTPYIFHLADLERGYNATGGEIFFPLIPFLIYAVVRAINETVAEMRKIYAELPDESKTDIKK